MFQGDAFQGNAFQIGSPLLYPWAPTTATAYLDGLPDRVRVVFYQGMASAPTPPTPATQTPITAGLQDVDKAFVPPFRAVGFQFSTFTQNDQRTATPITAGLQDFDPVLRRRLIRLFEDAVLATPAATFFETEGFDDFDLMLTRRPRLPPQDITFTVFTAPAFETEGFDDFDAQFIRLRRLSPQDLTAITITGVRASTPITAGLQDLDQQIRRRQAVLDFITSSYPAAAFFETEGFDDFDILQVRQRPRLLDFITTVYPSAATQTPTTAGVEPIFGPLFKRPYLQQRDVDLPINTTQVAQTPITAGIQGFDWTFIKAFKAALQQVTSTAPTTYNLAFTPITAGIQDFDRGLFRRPVINLDNQGFIFTPAQAFETEGFDDFDQIAFRRQRPMHDFGAQLVTQIRAITAGLQDLDQPLRRTRRLLDQGPGLIFAPTATATPITAGLQDLDFRFIRPMRPALQQVTSWAPVVITLAVTPTPFQFAIAGLPPFRYGMNVKLQMFEMRGQRIGIPSIVHRPSKGATLAPAQLLGTKDQPGLLGTKDQPGIGGEVEN